MRHIPPGFSLSACALAASVLVAACGGGDASAPGSTSSSSGFVIDGYVSGASVLCDTNDNGLADAGERSVTTDTSGFFRFVEVCAATLVATGGTNIDTGLPFVGKLKAPAGSSVITPLTTLLSAGVDPSKLNEVMGLPLNTNLGATDPARKQTGSTALVNPDLFKKTLVFQQLAQKTTEALAGLLGATTDAAKQAIYTQVVAGMATRIASSTPLNVGMTMDKAVIADLVEAAVPRVTGASALVNAETLGEVIAGALEVQGERILNATDATLASVTRTAQSNTQITSFVQTNRASMTAPPSPSTALLATSLTDQVTGTAPPPPPPPGGDTVILNFDDVLPIAANGGEGGDSSRVSTSPPAGGGSGSAYEVIRSGGTNFALAILETPLPLTSTRRTISARVYSPQAGIRMVIKLEGSSSTINSGDVEANEVVAFGWQTLTWTIPASAATYTKIVLLPNLGTVDPSPGRSYFFDDIKLKAEVVVVPPPAGTGTVIANFDTVVPGVRDTGDTGGFASITASPPAGGGSGSALAVLRNGGTDFALGVLDATVPFTATRKTLSARVYSPTAGIPMKIKLEGVGGAVLSDLNANETVVVGWQTLTWTFNPDLTKTYNAIVLLPNIGAIDAAPGKTYYFDDIKLLAAAGGGGGGGTPGVELGSGGPQPLTIASGNVTTGDGGNTMFVAGEGLFAVNYVGSAEPTPPNNLAAWPNAKTANFGSITGISGGDIGYFQDDLNLSNASQKVDEGGWVAGTALAPLGVPNFFRFFVLSGPVSNAAYMGLYVNAPNNGTVNVSSFSKLKVKVWGPAAMFERTNFDPVLEVTLTGPKVAGCTTGSGGSEITQNLNANLKNGAGGFYTMPLSGFTVKGLCGSDLGAADVLAKLARVVVTVPGTSFNYTNSVDSNFATGVNLGPVGFTNN